MKCRFCRSLLKETFVDLGMSPLSNTFLNQDQLNRPEKFYPLQAYVCDHCLLVQLEQFETPDQIFNNYVYFSSYSESWLHHAKLYAERITERFCLNKMSQIIEIGSNDGYLLQYFLQKGLQVLGIEPALNVAKVSEEKGIRTLLKFFGVNVAEELVAAGTQADLLVGNNVLAHVPDLNDFVAGMKIVLKSSGILTMEFPHIMQLIQQNQFDTIYHEHFSYFSFLTIEKVFAAHGFTLFDTEELPTHGGSLRIYAKHSDAENPPISKRISQLKAKELKEGYDQIETYLGFREQVKTTKRRLLRFFVDIKNQGKSIVGYGAPAKGNTLLNYCGIRTDFIDYTVDRNPHKQGLFLPGTHIPIYHPERIKETKPDYVFVLPWNLKDEILDQMAYIRQWGGKFVIPIPQVEVIE